MLSCTSYPRLMPGPGHCAGNRSKEVKACPQALRPCMCTCLLAVTTDMKRGERQSSKRAHGVNVGQLMMLSAAHSMGSKEVFPNGHRSRWNTAEALDALRMRLLRLLRILRLAKPLDSRSPMLRTNAILSIAA